MTSFQAHTAPNLTRQISMISVENFVGGRFLSELDASGRKDKLITEGTILGARHDWGKLALHIKVDHGAELKINYLLKDFENPESSVQPDKIVLATKNHKLTVTRS